MLVQGRLSLCSSNPVFSPACLRDIGPISLCCWFYFDVASGWSQWLWCGHRLHPKYVSQYVFNSDWGEYCNLNWTSEGIFEMRRTSVHIKTIGSTPIPLQPSCIVERGGSYHTMYMSVWMWQTVCVEGVHMVCVLSLQTTHSPWCEELGSEGTRPPHPSSWHNKVMLTQQSLLYVLPMA